MQIPELLFLFDTMRLTGEIPVQSDGVLQKAGFNFLKGRLTGGIWEWELFFWWDFFRVRVRVIIPFLERHIQDEDKCSVVPWAGENTIKEYE